MLVPGPDLVGHFESHPENAVDSALCVPERHEAPGEVTIGERAVGEIRRQLVDRLGHTRRVDPFQRRHDGVASGVEGTQALAEQVGHQLPDATVDPGDPQLGSLAHAQPRRRLLEQPEELIPLFQQVVPGHPGGNLSARRIKVNRWTSRNPLPVRRWVHVAMSTRPLLLGASESPTDEEGVRDRRDDCIRICPDPDRSILADAPFSGGHGRNAA
jgi:hypothetical protein